MARQWMVSFRTVLSGLLLTGCMQSVLLYDESGEPAERSLEETEREQSTIQVTTIDGSLYTLSDWKRDSLGNIEGQGTRKPWPERHPDISLKFNGRITSESIQRVSLEEFDVLSTILCAGIVGLIVVGYYFLTAFDGGGFGLSDEFGRALGGSSW